MKKLIILLLSLSGLLLLAACNNSSKAPTQTTSSGHIKIAVDEDLRSVMEEQLKVFDSSFPNAHIDVEYLPENECFNAFFKDSSARLIVVTRDLNQAESDNLKQNEQRARRMAVARGALAVIVNNSSPDSLMTVGQLKNILEGEFVRKYNVVVGDPGSGVVRYLSDSLFNGKDLPKNIFSVHHEDSVFKYVATHKDALGIVGSTNIYNQNVDTGVGTFRTDVQIVAMRNDSTYEFYQPYQAYIALQLYPLTREIYFISHDNWQGLATGFANFLANERGQLIFKHAWFAPMAVPLRVREVHISQ